MAKRLSSESAGKEPARVQIPFTTGRRKFLIGKLAASCESMVRDIEDALHAAKLDERHSVVSLAKMLDLTEAALKSISELGAFCAEEKRRDD